VRTATLTAITVGLLVGSVLGLPGPSPARAQSAAAPDTTAIVDLNQASLERILALPIPEEVAEAIVDYRTYDAYFTGLFDLMQVPGMTPGILEALRPLVEFTPQFEIEKAEIDEGERRIRERYYVLQRMLSEEGVSEGFVDFYADLLKDPRNINRLNFFDLVSHQNVSPIDAVAVLKEVKQAGRIENQRQLRAASGLTFWGYRNLRDYVRYDDPEAKRIRGDYQFRVYNTPYTLDRTDVLDELVYGVTTDRDLNTFGGRLNLPGGNPYVTNKFRFRYGDLARAGVITHRNLGEKDLFETTKWFGELRDRPPVNTPLGKFQLNGAVVGNYALAFGQGLIMESSDFFQPRRTGYGYSVRPVGLTGDISRSDEYTLFGVAGEATLGRVRGSAWYSHDDKDAIVNPDGSFNSYFVGTPRLDDDFLAGIRDDISSGKLAPDTGGADANSVADTTAFYPMRDVMDEQVYGANLKYEFMPGTYVGVTGMEMRYKNNIIHDFSTFDPAMDGRFNPLPENYVLNTGRLEQRDSELYGNYNSVNLGNYRRIWGAEAQTTVSNISVAAEYGKLETSGDSGAFNRMFSAGPEAFIVNAYSQWENLNVNVIYRDYDVGYDNPYNRAFSEDSRYEGTIVDGNAFRLRNPYWAQQGFNMPQPKSEQGWYVGTRYQFTRNFTLTGLEFDTWKRKADNADQKRVTLRAEYRPIFPVRFRIRQRVSSRHEDRPEDFRKFVSWDTRLEMLANLSDYDQIRFLYTTSNVQFALRGRLSGPASGGNVSSDADPTGQAGSPAQAVQGVLTHNFSDYLSLELSAEIYDGFLYNFEDNEFIVIDGKGFRNWAMLRSRLSDQLSWRIKWTWDHQDPRTFTDIRNFGDPAFDRPDGDNVKFDTSAYRFQLDYSF